MSCARLRDQRARRLIVRILEADARTGAALHQHLMSGIDEFANARRHQSDSILVNLDLFGDADFHGVAPFAAASWGTARVRKPGKPENCKNWSRNRVKWQNMAINGHFTQETAETAEGHQMKLDRYDRAIVRALQLDGRITNSQLAEGVNLSESACLRRVRALEESGFIEGYTALINQQKAGCPVNVFVNITLERQEQAHLHAFEEAARKVPEVMECYLMSGEYDYSVAGGAGRHRRFRTAAQSASHAIAECRAGAFEFRAAHGAELARIAGALGSSRGCLVTWASAPARSLFSRRQPPIGALPVALPGAEIQTFELGAPLELRARARPA